MKKEQVQREERRIIEGFATAGKIRSESMDRTINELQALEALRIASLPQHLVITNAATAAAIRKQFGREEVEIIITTAVETGTVHVITDEDLKRQLLENIKKRGF